MKGTGKNFKALSGRTKFPEVSQKNVWENENILGLIRKGRSIFGGGLSVFQVLSRTWAMQ